MMGPYDMHKAMRGPYDLPLEICPYCEFPECEADHVDVGVGMVQCGPFYCPRCGASEVHSLDSRVLMPKEKKTGWYLPHTPVSEHANAVGGVLVGHQTAKDLYALGLLDEKP